MVPEVSICLPVLNGRRFLGERMASIVSQTFDGWELIVCDSHSSDGSWELLSKYGHDRRVRLFRVPQEGVYAGWNACLERARGKYVHIATADDTAAPDFLERLVAILDRQLEVDLAVCQFCFTDANGSEMPPPRRRLDQVYGKWLDVAHVRTKETELLIHFCLGGIPWTTAGALIFRRTLLKKTGYFRGDMGSRADIVWALRASMHSGTVSLPARMATFRQHREQASRMAAPGWAEKNLREKERVLDELADRIPTEWRQHGDWRERLLWKARQDYLVDFALNRQVMMTELPRFMAGMARALVKEPRYLLERVRLGFSWNSPEFTDEYDYFWKLIEDWHVDWEPRPLYPERS